ncbi:chitin deacetylase [Podila epicladia]|nr:chitin deacetylase [Podila epicladia]
MGYTPRIRASRIFPRTLHAALCLLLVASTTLLHADAAFNISHFPPPGRTPSVTSPEVRKWLSELDLSRAPSIETNTGEPPECPTVVPEGVCYWTCDDCSADDVIECPDRGVWGITFDDGPTPATPELLRFLGEKKVKATFFLVGGNVAQYPELVVQEAQAGHHLASHTWSHHALTTLTNEEIVAEMRWTEKAIFDATGYRVRYMRPPYGDVDNRVRFVLKKMGYTIVDWSGDRFDSNDWQSTGSSPLNALDSFILDKRFKVLTLSFSVFSYSLKQLVPQMSPSAVSSTFRRAISGYAATLRLETKGFISLEHDLSAETVAIAKAAIPLGLARNLTITTVADCLGDKNPYANVMNSTRPAGSAAANATRSGTGSGQEVNGVGRAMANQGALVTSGWIQRMVWSGVLGSLVVGLSYL